MKKIALALALTAALASNAQAHGYGYPAYPNYPGYSSSQMWGAAAVGVIVGAVIASAPARAAQPVYTVPQPVYPQPVPNYACPPGTAAFYTNITSYDAYGRPYSSYQLTCR